jgi:transcriptional regulator with XRE-family HTH domain
MRSMGGNDTGVFGQRLRYERERLGWSVETLAGKMQLRARTIERWEDGSTENPPLNFAARAALVLGVSLDYLAGNDDSVNGEAA